MTTTHVGNTKMIKTVLGFAKGSPYKMVAIILVVITIVSSIFFTGSNHGYNKAKAQELEAINIALDKQAKEYKKLIAKKEKQRVAALQTAAKLRKLPKVSHNEIKQAANASECKRLGLEFNRVFNRMVGTPPAD